MDGVTFEQLQTVFERDNPGVAHGKWACAYPSPHFPDFESAFAKLKHDMHECFKEGVVAFDKTYHITVLPASDSSDQSKTLLAVFPCL